MMSPLAYTFNNVFGIIFRNIYCESTLYNSDHMVEDPRNLSGKLVMPTEHANNWPEKVLRFTCFITIYRIHDYYSTFSK